MSDLFGNHIVGFLTRRLIFKDHKSVSTVVTFQCAVFLDTQELAIIAYPQNLKTFFHVYKYSHIKCTIFNFTRMNLKSIIFESNFSQSLQSSNFKDRPQACPSIHTGLCVFLVSAQITFRQLPLWWLTHIAF